MTQSAANRAYEHTKRQILDGTIGGGQQVSEASVADQLDISRTPVHEAFLRLEVEKLLVLSSRRGAVAAPMAPDEARDVLEMREAIESSTARRALSAPLSEDVLTQLRDNIDHQRSASEAGEVDAFVDLDSAFHAIMIRASRNKTALYIHDLLRDRQHRLRWQLLHVGHQEIAAAFDEHLQMLDAAERGHADRFCELVSSHVRRHRGIL